MNYPTSEEELTDEVERDEIPPEYRVDPEPQVEPDNVDPAVAHSGD